MVFPGFSIGINLAHKSSTLVSMKQRGFWPYYTWARSCQKTEVIIPGVTCLRIISLLSLRQCRCLRFLRSTNNCRSPDVFPTCQQIRRRYQPENQRLERRHSQGAVPALKVIGISMNREDRKVFPFLYTNRVLAREGASLVDGVPQNRKNKR